MINIRLLRLLLLLIGVAPLLSPLFAQRLFDEQAPRFVTALQAMEGGSVIMAEKGTRRVVQYNATFDQLEREWFFNQAPTGLLVSDNRLYVTTFETQGELSVIDLSGTLPVKRVAVGSGATTPLLDPSGKFVYVLTQFQNRVEKIELSTMRVVATVDLLREPKNAVIDPTTGRMFVCNFLPNQRANQDTVAASVSVIDLKSFRKERDILLENGSNALHGICLSPDGKYVLITHNLGRFQVPTTQLQQGWMNTSAMSIIGAKDLAFRGSVLLDDPERGAAGVWSVASSKEKIVVAHSGTHEVSLIDYPAFLQKFEPYKDKPRLAYDLRFMQGIRQRVQLYGNGPRVFTLQDDKLYVPTYFSDTLNIVSLSRGEVSMVPLVKNRTESRAQQGEKHFNDAMLCFQNWQSCNGCHPGDARTDGMSWDLMNDGIGNSKNCKSMLHAHVTPPAMISGIRASAYLAVRKGFSHIQFAEVSEEVATRVDDYLLSLRPIPSPYLIDGKLSPKAIHGRKVYEQLKCDDCHSGPLYTDLKMYRIGADVEFEKGWDTPTLVEVWRTAPYLFDGRAATMQEVFEVHKHGIKGKVSKKDMESLVEYVNSL